MISASPLARAKQAIFKWRQKTGIQTRFVLAIFLITLSMSFIGLLINTKYDMEQIRQADAEKNLIRLKALQVDFVKVIADYTPDSAVDLVNRLNSFPDIHNVILRDHNNRLVFRYDFQASDATVLPDFIESDESSVIIFGSDDIVLHHMVTYGGRRYGWVTIWADTIGIKELYTDYTLTAALLVAGTVIFALVLALMAGHYVSRPIRNLAAFTRSISHAHDFSRRLETGKRGEIGDLYDGVNVMLDTISMAEQEIHRLNESRIRNIVESALDGVVSITVDGLITYWGRQNVRIFGWLEEEVLGQSLDELVIPERFRRQHRDGLQRFLASGEGRMLNQRIELAGLHRDGHEFPLELSITAYKEKDGWVFNAFIRDLTELREAEKNLRVVHIQLLRKERLAAVGQVTATVAHELRNPMGTIVNSVYMLSEMLGTSDLAVNNIVDRVNRNVQRCNTIIDDLLDFTSEHAMNPVPWELDAWLKRLLDEYEYEHQVKVEIVRKLSCGGRVLFDTVHFQSAVTNVLDNAIQALGERPVDGGRIEVSTVIDNNRIGVVIGDNGPGIPEDERNKVFEPLYSTKNFGIGLGLPAVAKIMKQHGGEVVLEENTNGGVRVSLWLDRAEPAVTNVLSDYHQDKKNVEVQ